MAKPGDSELPDLQISYRPEAGVWVVEDFYVYHDGPTAIAIAKGFATDPSSRPLWSLIAPFELSIVAPIVHDLIDCDD